MPITYELSNGSYWQQAWSTTLVAQGVPNHADRFYPLPPQSVPVILNAPIIAIYTHSLDDLNERRYWARVSFRVATGILLGGVGESMPGDYHRAWIGGLTVIEVPPYLSSYSLVIHPPHWYRNFQISVYYYTGPINDSILAAIASVQADLTAFRADFNQYAGL